MLPQVVERVKGDKIHGFRSPNIPRIFDNWLEHLLNDSFNTDAVYPQAFFQRRFST